MAYPRKPVVTPLPLLDAIKERWSPVAFSDRPVEPEKIETLFEAARWAPSSFNEQPWRYIYATKDDPAPSADYAAARAEDRLKLESLLVEGNSWAKNAYMLLITFAASTFARNQKPNRHALHDLGAATGFLALQLSSLGLIGHQMAGFDWENANTILGVPGDFIPGSMMAIGYPGDPAMLDPKLQERQNAPRARKDQKELVFRGAWRHEGADGTEGTRVLAQ